MATANASRGRFFRRFCNCSILKRTNTNTNSKTSRLAGTLQFPRTFLPAYLPACLLQAGSPRKVDVILFGAEFYEPPLSTLRSKPPNQDRCCWCSAALLVDYTPCCSKHGIKAGFEVLLPWRPSLTTWYGLAMSAKLGRRSPLVWGGLSVLLGGSRRQKTALGSAAAMLHQETFLRQGWEQGRVLP